MFKMAYVLAIIGGVSIYFLESETLNIPEFYLNQFEGPLKTR